MTGHALRRWKPAALVLAVVLAVVAAIWLLREKPGAHDAGAGAEAARATIEARNEVIYPPAFPYATTGALPATGKETYDLCGFGKIETMNMPAALQQEADAAILRVVERIERKGEREQALGVLMRATLASASEGAAIHGNDPLQCVQTPACAKRMDEAHRRVFAPAAEQLARIAATTRDPLSYAAALRACRAFRTDTSAASCAGIRAEQLAQIDPDNVATWLEVAADAAARRDAAAVESALQRAARSKRFDPLALPFGDLVAGIDVSYEPVRTLIVMQVANAQFNQEPPPYGAAASYCSKELAATPGRQDVCAALATQLAERGPDGLALANGVVIGQRTSLPAERIGRYEGDNKAFMADLASNNPGGGFSCEWSARLEAWMNGVIKHGEVGYMRQLRARQKPR
jgi:hypothetical protein